MSKKSEKKKMMLGRQIKRNKRIPVLAVLRTHRRIEYNILKRNWRKKKLGIRD